MKVHLHLSGPLSNFEKSEIEVSLSEDACVSDLLKLLIDQYGEGFGQYINNRESWQISINGRLHFLTHAAEVKLKNQDKLLILPQWFQIIAGG